MYLKLVDFYTGIHSEPSKPCGDVFAPYRLKSNCQILFQKTFNNLIDEPVRSVNWNDNGHGQKES
jgi:hypothetical protein